MSFFQRTCSIAHAVLIGGVAVCALAGSAHADLLHSTLSCGVAGGGNFTCNQSTAVVGRGVEFKIGNSDNRDYISEDFSKNKLEISFQAAEFLTGTILENRDLTSPFLSYVLLSSEGVTGFNASNISLVEGMLMVDLRGTTEVRGAEIEIGLKNASPVPEPSSLILMSTGLLAGLVVVRRVA